jgi:hypothetical protein
MAAKLDSLYLRVALGLPRSDGAAVLKRRLEVDRAWSFALSLWDWFAEKHPEGEVAGPECAYLIAEGSGWTGDPDKFCAAMVAAGYLASVPEGFRVRGWAEWAGYHFNVRAKAKAKKKAQRARQSPERPGDVPGTGGGQNTEKGTSDGDSPRDPSPISDLSSVSSEGVQGEAAPRRRSGLASPFPPGQDPSPNITAVLAALFDHGVIDAAPPSARAEGRVEAVIGKVGVTLAVDRLRTVYADPKAPRPLTYHLDAIQGLKPKPAKGDDRGRPDLSTMDYSRPPEF